MPGLAGVDKGYMAQQMKDFKAGKRPATIMQQLAKGFSDEQIEQLALLRFMCAAGIVHRRPSRSISSQVASRTSWLRTPVRTRNSSASRPYEGGAMCLGVGVVALGWLFGKNRPPLGPALGRFIAPVILILSLTAAALATTSIA